MKIPDRQEHEKELQTLQQEISDTQKVCLRYFGPKGNRALGSIIPHRAKFRNAQADHKRSRIRNCELTKDIEDLGTEIDKKDSQLQQIEPSLIKKNFKDLDDLINLKKREYNRARPKSTKEDEALVKEMDKLERSKKRLEEFLQIQTERNRLRSQRSTLRQEKEGLLKSMKNYKVQSVQLYRELKELETKAADASQRLRDIYAKKKALILTYNTQRHDYETWKLANSSAVGCSSQRLPKVSRAPSAASASSVAAENCTIKRAASLRQSDQPPHATSDQLQDAVNELEPFDNEKRICLNLIAYLEKQQVVVEDGPSFAQGSSCAAEKPSGTADTVDAASEFVPPLKEEWSTDSADSVRSDGVHFHRKDGGSLSPSRQRKKQAKKDKRRGTQSLTLAVEFFSLFNAIGMSPPKTYADVPGAIDDLKEKLNSYKAYTDISTPNESDPWDYGSDSDLDSALASFSDISSVSSNLNLTQSSICEDSSDPRFSASVLGLVSPRGSASGYSSPTGNIGGPKAALAGASFGRSQSDTDMQRHASANANQHPAAAVEAPLPFLPEEAVASEPLFASSPVANGSLKGRQPASNVSPSSGLGTPGSSRFRDEGIDPGNAESKSSSVESGSSAPVAAKHSSDSDCLEEKLQQGLVLAANNTS